MAEIKEYEKKDGSTAYMFNTYIGINPKTGKPKRTTRRGFKTKKEARLALARLELGEDKPTPKNKTQKKYTTFNDVYKMWFENYKESVTPATLAGTERYFRLHILPELGSKVITDITYNDCQSAVIKWSKKQKRFSTIKDYASKIMRYARKNQLISYNPFDDIDLPKKPKSNKKESEQFYTKKELSEFLAWGEKNLLYGDYAAFRLLAFSGIRKGELRALKWNDLNLKTMKLDINKAVKVSWNGKEEIGPTKNDKSTRIIGLDNDTIKVLRKWKLEQQKYFLKHGISLNNDQFIFTNEDNTSYMRRDHLRDMIKKYPGKKITPHGFRHTHATLSLDAGINYKDVQKRLGHKTADMTMNVYAHAIGDDTKITQIFADYIEN